MNDDRAVEACLAGDSAAFRHLVDRYEARAIAHARILTRNEADAADATQDAYVDAFRSLHRFDRTREFYPWFYVLLRNRCLKQLTRRGTRSESGVLPMRAVAAGVSEQQLDVWRAIERLDPRDAELLILKHLEGWTYEELSTALDVPRGTVMSRLYSARQKLLAIIQEGDRDQ
jgi:RNA polymerase sigma-70 factor (ECF subfamily)